jgi:hypothetical protein
MENGETEHQTALRGKDNIDDLRCSDEKSSSYVQEFLKRIYGLRHRSLIVASP